MKVTKIVIPLAVAVSTALACLLVGRLNSQAEPGTTTTKSSTASDLLQRHLFNQACNDVTFTESVIEMLDSGRTEDAKQMLRTQQSGSIASLDQVLDSPPLSEKEIAQLRDLNESITPKAKQRENANRALARVVRHRAEHPWTYKGNLPHANDPDIEAKLTAILNRAAASQK